MNAGVPQMAFYLCIEAQTQFPFVQRFGAFWKQLLDGGCMERSFVQNPRSVWKWRWACSHTAPGSKDSRRTSSDLHPLYVLLRMKQWLLSLPPPLFPFISSASRWWIMTNVRCAMKARDCKAQKDVFGLAWFECLWRGACINPLNMLIS